MRPAIAHCSQMCPHLRRSFRFPQFSLLLGRGLVTQTARSFNENNTRVKLPRADGFTRRRYLRFTNSGNGNGNPEQRGFDDDTFKNISVTSELEGAAPPEVFSENDIADLNSDVSGLVGSLGDPDLELQGDAHILPGAASAAFRSRRGDALKLMKGTSGIKDSPDPSKARVECPSTKSETVSGSKGTKSILVLNGAACFIGGRLASTGEPQENVERSMAEAAAAYDMVLNTYTSNRACELLDRLCGGTFDGVIYNPAGFRAVYNIIDARHHAREARRLDRDQTSSPLESLFAGQSRGPESDALSSLEYALVRTQCPVVRICTRDVPLDGEVLPLTWSDETRGCFGRGIVRSGVIAGFTGSTSYKLAISAMADILQ
ncbi:unnamed protein product [Ascophyllum nodosum]